MNFTSSPFTHIVSTTTGDITYEHLQLWLEDFISLSYGKTNSAILIDPRTTILTPDFEILCQKSHINLITVDLNYYLINILSPIFSLFDKQCSEVNRLDKMYLKSAGDLKRIIYTIWCSLRTLKQNEQIFKIFNQTIHYGKILIKNMLQSLQPPIPPIYYQRKKRKRTL